MNLYYSQNYSESNIPIRIIGELSYFSFQLLNTEDDLDIHIKENELIFHVSDHANNTTYFSESINCDLSINNILSKKQLVSLDEPVVVNTVFSFSDSKNSDNFTTPVVTFTPLNYDKKEIFKLILSIDVLLFYPNDTTLFEISQTAITQINEQILNFKKFYSSYIQFVKFHKIKKLIPLHYKINNEIITVILPDIEIDEEENWRKEIFADFNLDKTLQRCQSLYPPIDVLRKLGGNKLINPHLQIKTIYKENFSVIGRYTYYHYMQDSYNDRGWGCAYRSLQTIVSWFVWQGWSKINIPTHKDIQSILVKIGDKEKSFLNSRSWIGSFEISLVLQNLLNIESRIISLNAGSELAGTYDQLQEHFNDGGAPVMIGGGQLAHTIIGVSKDSDSKIRFLILDPHYTGSPNNIATILGKGWCGWKELTFWKENLPYNLCLPLLTK